MRGISAAFLLFLTALTPAHAGNQSAQGGRIVVANEHASTLQFFDLATGKLLKRKGSLRITGTYDRSSGAFSAKFRGTLVK